MGQIGAYIDKITKSIEEKGTGKNLATDVISVNPSDLKTVLKRSGWLFNWKIELMQMGRELYKLVISGDHVIQGLLSLERMDGYIEMHLIENAPHNRGRSKKYEGVAANLVAFACKFSYEAGFQGYVAFRAKTKLIQHYRDSLGAELIYKDRMSVGGKSAEKLVNSYFKGYLHE